MSFTTIPLFKKIQEVWDRSYFQILLSLVWAFIFIFSIYYFFQNRQAYEQSPKLYSYVPEKGRKFGEMPSPVEVSLFLRSMPTFDEDKGHFVLTGSLSFYYKPGQISLDTLGNFQVENGNILEKSGPISRYIDDHVFSVYDVKLSFFSEMNYKFFPITDHKIFLKIKFPEAFAQDLLLETYRSDVTVANNFSPKGWKLVDYSVDAGYYIEKPADQNIKKIVTTPEVAFTLYFSQPGIRKTIIIMMPSFFLFLLIVLSLVIPSQSFRDDRLLIHLSIGGTTGLIIQRLVVENITPRIDYFTLVDHLYVYFISCAILSLIINTMMDSQRIQFTRFKACVAHCIQIGAIVYLFLLHRL